MSVLLLLLAAVPVRAEDYGWFELDLLPGWRAEEPRQLSGT